jgi:hypothetical protein
MDFATFNNFKEEDIILYYDGPLSWFCYDTENTRYYIQWVDRNDIEDYDTWYGVKMSDETKTSYFADEIDLRDLFLKSESNTFYKIITANRDSLVEDNITELPVSDLDLTCLPDAGVRYNKDLTS